MSMFDPERELHPKQLLAFKSKANEILFGGAAGGGKALALDTPIPTPAGWSTMGELQPGDKVFDENGTPCNVVACTEIMHGRPCYRVTFSDGTTIVADGKHQWLTMDNTERERATRLTPEFRASRRAKRNGRGTGKRPDLAAMNASRQHDYLSPPEGTIRTTEEIAATIRHNGRTNHSVQVAKPLSLPEIDLPVDPYVLGVWLGDGTSVSGQLTTADEEIVEAIRGAGYKVAKQKSNFYSYGIYRLKAQLRDLGVLGNKHIPARYLRASTKQRLALLQGLMDTDGTCLPSGACEFYSCNETLARQACELINSLGIKAVVREGRAMLAGNDCRPKCRVKFTTAIPMFRLTRKLEGQKSKVNPICTRRMIVSCEMIESVPVKCIQVDSASHLYLAGKAMVPTHNSFYIRYMAVWCAVHCPGIQIYLFRRTYPDLSKNHMEGPASFPVVLAPLIEAKMVSINYGKGAIQFANGARIFLCHCQHEKDVISYQGAEIHLLLVDELTHFTDKIYRFLRGRCRCGSWKPPKQLEGCFPRILNGSNPGGVGHNWVKASFVTSAPAMEVWRTSREEGNMLRQFIPSKLSDNPTMTMNDPDYSLRLEGLGSPELVRAMLEGDWDIVSGGAMDDVWRKDVHVVQPFRIPRSWYVDRAFDWGSSRPFSVGWWAESNGEEVTLLDGTRKQYPKGCLFRIAEWYGWQDGKPDTGCKMLAKDVAKGIKERESKGILSLCRRINPGPADNSIFDLENGNCIATDMAKEGVKWIRSNKSAGSRKNGLELMRTMLAAPLKAAREGVPLEEPGLFVFNTCHQFIRTIPVLPRSQSDSEDVDSRAEDHIYDEARYRVLQTKATTKSQEI